MVTEKVSTRNQNTHRPTLGNSTASLAQTNCEEGELQPVLSSKHITEHVGYRTIVLSLKE
jgi:hypothetical protein